TALNAQEESAELSLLLLKKLLEGCSARAKAQLFCSVLGDGLNTELVVDGSSRENAQLLASAAGVGEKIEFVCAGSSFEKAQLLDSELPEEVNHEFAARLSFIERVA